MSRVAFLLVLARVCFIVIDACSLIPFQCLPACVLPRVPLGDDASLRSTTPSEPDKDLLPKFLLLREVRLRLERVRSTMLTRSQRGPPYFSSRSYQCKMP